MRIRDMKTLRLIVSGGRFFVSGIEAAKSAVCVVFELDDIAGD
jgi:hypothetical protein